MERRKDGKTDRLKTVYPPKLRLRGVLIKENIKIFQLKIVIFAPEKIVIYRIGLFTYRHVNAMYEAYFM